MRVLTVLIVGFLLSSCVFNYKSYDKLSIRTRGEIRQEDLSFLRKGKTTIDDIFLKIGEPDYWSEDERTLIYLGYILEETVIFPLGNSFSFEFFIHILEFDENYLIKSLKTVRNAGFPDYADVESILSGIGLVITWQNPVLKEKTALDAFHVRFLDQKDKPIPGVTVVVGDPENQRQKVTSDNVGAVKISCSQFETIKIIVNGKMLKEISPRALNYRKWNVLYITLMQ